MKKTKIVATIGPASDDRSVLLNLAKEGVNVFRLNFSHGTHEYHKSNFDKIRSIETELGRSIGILQDISGPKIRVGKLENPFDLKPGDKIYIKSEEILGTKISANEYVLSINQPTIKDLIKVDEQIFMYDGAIRTRVVKVDKDIEVIVENSGTLSSNKGVNFPNTKLNIDVITPKDEIDLEWGAKNGVDFVAISFVQNANDILKAKSILAKFGSRAKVYAKIEKFDAIENIDEIIKFSDGIMVARGDLGIEVPYYKVPSLQKSIIKKANAANKPVITATQMMLSMATNETATRAEISDVANAVLDGTDAVMLSEESAVGINPVAVVRAMSKTICEAEKIYPYNKFDDFSFEDETDMVASSSANLASKLGAAGIISITSSGQSAIKMSRNRPNIKIIAVCHDEDTLRSLSIVWGVVPALVNERDKLNILLRDSVSNLVKKGFMQENLTYVVTAGYPAGAVGSTNYIRILKKEQIDYYLNDV